MMEKKLRKNARVCVYTHIFLSRLFIFLSIYTHTHTPESLCYTSETSIIPYIHYTSI